VLVDGGEVTLEQCGDRLQVRVGKACRIAPARLADPGGWTGAPQAVQNWSPGGISLPHLVQYLTIGSPAPRAATASPHR
jgi:hypothetical protein